MPDETSDLLSEDQRLQLIADLIGCRPEDFSAPRGSVGEIGEMAELLRLWCTIEADDDRARVLDMARHFAAG